MQVKDKEKTLVDCLLKSSLQTNEELKIKSLDLLLSLFSKNEGLIEFINRLILIQDGLETRIFSRVLETTKQLELSKEKYESSLTSSTLEFSEFERIINALMQEVTRTFKNRNEYSDILKSLNRKTEFYQILKMRLMKKFAQPTRLFQYLNHSIHIVELLIDILRLDRISPLGIVKMETSRQRSFAKFFDYLRITCSDNDLIKQSILLKMPTFFKLNLANTKFFNNYLFFLDEWIENSHNVLADINLVKQITTQILNFLNNSEDKTDPLCILALSIIRKLIITKKRVYKENQNLILSMIFSQKYENIFSNFFGDRLKIYFNEFDGKTRKFCDIRRANSLKISITHPKIRFLNHYFLAVNGCITEKNRFTENFCQNLYSTKALYEIIKIPHLEISIKHSITEYMLESFILTDISHKVSQVFIVENVLHHLTIEFDLGIKTLLDESEDDYEMCDVIIVDEMGCRRYQDVLENYLILLAKTFYNVVILDLPELSCKTFANKYSSFLNRVLKILKKTIDKFGNDLKDQFVGLIRAISQIRYLEHEGIVRAKEEALVIVQDQKLAKREMIADLFMNKVNTDFEDFSWEISENETRC